MTATPHASLLMQQHDMCLLVCIHAGVDAPTIQIHLVYMRWICRSTVFSSLLSDTCFLQLNCWQRTRYFLFGTLNCSAVYLDLFSEHTLLPIQMVRHILQRNAGTQTACLTRHSQKRAVKSTRSNQKTWKF